MVMVSEIGGLGQFGFGQKKCSVRSDLPFQRQRETESDAIGTIQLKATQPEYFVSIHSKGDNQSGTVQASVPRSGQVPIAIDRAGILCSTSEAAQKNDSGKVEQLWRAHDSSERSVPKFLNYSAAQHHLDLVDPD